MNKTIVYGGILIAIVIALGGYFFPQVKQVAAKFGAVDTTCQGYTSCFSDLYATTQFGGTGAIRAAGTLIADGAATLSSTLTMTGLATLDGGVVYSDTLSTSTNSTSMTLAASDITNYTAVIATPNVNSLTYTFPASSTLSAFIPNAGDWTAQCWENATGTAAKTLTFAAGTGETLVGATTTLTIAPQMMGCVKYMRNGGSGSKANDISIFFD